jgi:hypothetical protein
VSTASRVHKVASQFLKYGSNAQKEQLTLSIFFFPLFLRLSIGVIRESKSQIGFRISLINAIQFMYLALLLQNGTTIQE